MSSEQDKSKQIGLGDITKGSFGLTGLADLKNGLRAGLVDNYESLRVQELMAQLDVERRARNDLQSELESRELVYAEREEKFIKRQREYEKSIMRKQEEALNHREQLENELEKRQSEFQQALQQLKQEKELLSEEARNNIKSKSSSYVEQALKDLSEKENKFYRSAQTWSRVGAGAISIAIVFFCTITYLIFSAIPNPITWEFIVFSVFKGLVVLAMFAALSKYAFVLGDSYMQESLKNADRQHAINFGKFYLESYGAAADWAQIKEAFEHWNMTGSNAFSRGEIAPLDIGALERAVAVVEKFGKCLPSFGKGKNE